jgi:hypothetical protein
MAFQITALDLNEFSHLFGQDSALLAKQGIQRVVADSKPGYPCRVSLQDAEVGENLLLMNYEHQTKPSPFRSCHAIFVRESAIQAMPGKNEIPTSLKLRLLSVRAFDSAGMMVDADIVEGEHLDSLIERMLEDEAVDNLHIHNARPGCYAAKVERR